MASNPEQVRLTVLTKLQEALDEEAILEEQILALMHRFADRFTDRRVEINNLMVLHDHPLIDYDKVIMASEEAKTKWLRMANRCIVDENYVRESRPPSFIPSSSKSESENSSYNLPADTRWWLNQQPKVNPGSFCNTQQETFADYVGIHELEDVIGDTLQKKTKLLESWTEEDELVAFSHEPEKLFSEFESQWIRVKYSNGSWGGGRWGRY
ncbi:hypothetical protein Tco_1316938 [Tanacetum coccineum]